MPDTQSTGGSDSNVSNELKMYGALKQLDPKVSDQIAQKYQDVLRPEARTGKQADDVSFDARADRCRNELGDAIISSVHTFQKGGVSQSRR